MPERDFPPRGRQPASELEEMLAQVQQYWQGFRGGPIIGLVCMRRLLRGAPPTVLRGASS